MEVCKYCNTLMNGEYETLTSSNHYRFFYNCPKCGAIYEGERKDKGNLILFNKSRWFNPTTKQFEE
jgi:RNase P subunit RPR2